MKNLFIMIATVSPLAFATPPHGPNPNSNPNHAQNQNQSQAQLVLQATSTIVTASPTSSSLSSAEGGRGGDATGGNATGGAANNLGNSQTTNIVSKRSVASAAPVYLAPTAVCSGTTSGGAQGSTFGISFGTSWTDENCILLEQVRHASALGQDDVAAEMMCEVEAYRNARLRTGKPCALDQIPVKRQTSTNHPDPIVRYRLGQ